MAPYREPKRIQSVPSTCFWTTRYETEDHRMLLCIIFTFHQTSYIVKQRTRCRLYQQSVFKALGAELIQLDTFVTTGLIFCHFQGI